MIPDILQLIGQEWNVESMMLLVGASKKIRSIDVRHAAILIILAHVIINLRLKEFSANSIYYFCSHNIFSFFFQVMPYWRVTAHNK